MCESIDGGRFIESEERVVLYAMPLTPTPTSRSLYRTVSLVAWTRFTRGDLWMQGASRRVLRPIPSASIVRLPSRQLPVRTSLATTHKSSLFDAPRQDPSTHPAPHRDPSLRLDCGFSQRSSFLVVLCFLLRCFSGRFCRLPCGLFRRQPLRLLLYDCRRVLQSAGIPTNDADTPRVRTYVGSARPSFIEDELLIVFLLPQKRSVHVEQRRRLLHSYG